MFSILLDVWHQIESLKPAFISKTPHFNFITVHYFWIIGMALLGSVAVYIRGEIAYIDALFLASGAATQSGLNTVDINKLHSWQQVVLFLSPIITNPIMINSFVVFLRLYWFEKRFQHVVREASKHRRSISKTLSKAKTNERDLGEEERGVDGRDILVMHNGTGPNGVTKDGSVSEELNDDEKINAVARENRASSSVESRPDTRQEASQRPQIKFADQVKPSDVMNDEMERMPIQRAKEEHIAFLERQRNAEDGAVLRIPGPRDADAGVAPQAVEEADSISPIQTRRTSVFSSARPSEDLDSPNADGNANSNGPVRRNITIEEPTRSTNIDHVAEDSVAAKHTLSVFKLRKPRIFKGQKLHREGAPTQASARSNTFQTIRTALSMDKTEGMPYLSWEPTVGRNSAFVDLTEAQREELGGIEYRSLKSLALILMLYFWGFSLFGVICLVPWVFKSKTYGAVVDGDGQGRAWWGIFTSNSAFTDLGYTLTPDSMISFQTAVWPLLLMSFLIIVGNTGFPIMLRIIIWVTSRYVPKESGIWEELQFLLDHPRRCFTLLFPAKATWWLFWILVILNGLDLFFFIILDLGNTIVTQLPVHIRVLDGWFQAVSTRTAGFAVVNLAELHPAIQVSYLIMMYISVLPIAISVRRTNVYEEKSLGIYGSPTEENDDEAEPSYVGAHLRRQLSFDLWYIFLGFFIIAISEGKRIQSGDPAFTMFTVLFEIVSAYGTVGLSLGYTNINASFSAEFGVIAKLVIIAMQIRGRHRGLPYELDRAILLPSENLQKKEAHDDATRLRNRHRSSVGSAAMVGNQNTAVSSGARTDRDRSLGRSKSRDLQAQNFLGTLLHPGPTIPNSHRNLNGGRPVSARRYSIATPGMREEFSESIDPRGEYSIPFGGYGTEELRGRRAGRKIVKPDDAESAVQD